MKVKELVERLMTMPQDADVSAYTKCGTDEIGEVRIAGGGYVCLVGKSDVCLYLADCEIDIQLTSGVNGSTNPSEGFCGGSNPSSSAKMRN